MDRVAARSGAPVRLGGDGVCMALGERWRGAGRGAQFLLGMVVSTGVGGGLVLDGAPYDGRTGDAGTSATWSSTGRRAVHVRRPRLRRDGRRGSVDGAVGAGHNGWDAPPDADAGELADAAAAGDAVALRAFGGGDGGGRDDRVGRRGLRPGPRRRRRWRGQIRRAAVRPAS